MKKKIIYIENYSKLEVKRGPSVSQNNFFPLHQNKLRLALSKLILILVLPQKKLARTIDWF